MEWKYTKGIYNLHRNKMPIYMYRRLQKYLVNIISIYLLQKSLCNIPLTKFDIGWLLLIIQKRRYLCLNHLRYVRTEKQYILQSYYNTMLSISLILLSTVSIRIINLNGAWRHARCIKESSATLLLFIFTENHVII